MTLAFRQVMRSNQIYYYPVNDAAKALVDFRNAGFKTLTESHFKTLCNAGIYPLVVNDPMGIPIVPCEKMVIDNDIAFNTQDYDIDLTMFRKDTDIPDYLY